MDDGGGGMGSDFYTKKDRRNGNIDTDAHAHAHAHDSIGNNIDVANSITCRLNDNDNDNKSRRKQQRELSEVSSGQRREKEEKMNTSSMAKSLEELSKPPCDGPSKERNDELRKVVTEKMVEFYTHAKNGKNNKISKTNIMKDTFSTTEEYFDGKITHAYIKIVGGKQGINIRSRYNAICKRKELDKNTSRMLTTTASVITTTTNDTPLSEENPVDCKRGYGHGREPGRDFEMFNEVINVDGKMNDVIESISIDRDGENDDDNDDDTSDKKDDGGGGLGDDNGEMDNDADDVGSNGNGDTEGDNGVRDNVGMENEDECDRDDENGSNNRRTFVDFRAIVHDASFTPDYVSISNLSSAATITIEKQRGRPRKNPNAKPVTHVVASRSSARLTKSSERLIVTKYAPPTSTNETEPTTVNKIKLVVGNNNMMTTCKVNEDDSSLVEQRKELPKQACERQSKERNDKLWEIVREKMVEFYTHAKSGGGNKISFAKDIFPITETYFAGKITHAYIKTVGGRNGQNIRRRYHFICKIKEPDRACQYCGEFLQYLHLSRLIKHEKLCLQKQQESSSVVRRSPGRSQKHPPEQTQPYSDLNSTSVGGSSSSGSSSSSSSDTTSITPPSLSDIVRCEPGRSRKHSPEQTEPDSSSTSVGGSGETTSTTKPSSSGILRLGPRRPRKRPPQQIQPDFDSTTDFDSTIDDSGGGGGGGGGSESTSTTPSSSLGVVRHGLGRPWKRRYCRLRSNMNGIHNISCEENLNRIPHIRGNSAQSESKNIANANAVNPSKRKATTSEEKTLQSPPKRTTRMMTTTATVVKGQTRTANADVQENMVVDDGHDIPSTSSVVQNAKRIRVVVGGIIIISSLPLPPLLDQNTFSQGRNTIVLDGLCDMPSSALLSIDVKKAKRIRVVVGGMILISSLPLPPLFDQCHQRTEEKSVNGVPQGKRNPQSHEDFEIIENDDENRRQQQQNRRLVGQNNVSDNKELQSLKTLTTIPVMNDYTLRRSVIELLTDDDNEDETENLKLQVSLQSKVARPSSTNTESSVPYPASCTINLKTLTKDGDSKQSSSPHGNIPEKFRKQGEGVPTAFVVDLLGDGEEEDQLALTKQQAVYLVQENDEIENGILEDNEDVIIIGSSVSPIDIDLLNDNVNRQEEISGSGSLEGDDDVQITGSTGKNALSDFPHPRHQCVVKPFAKNPQDFCLNCYCYICDIKASECTKWQDLHCKATDDIKWQQQRRKVRNKRKAPERARQRLATWFLREPETNQRRTRRRIIREDEE